MIRFKKPNLGAKIRLLFYGRKNTSIGRKLKRLLVLIFWLLIVSCFAVLLVFIYFSKDLPSPDKINQRQIIQSTKIYDRTGQVLLYDIHGEEKRTVVGFDEIPQNVKNATLATEDANFYHHFGIDFRGILRSVFYNITGKKILGQKTSVGGSTITQQFIRSAVLTSEKTYARKLKEVILAIELEMKYSKDEIFSLYLNQIPYGSNAYGIEAAARTFFDKGAKDLDLAEAALLAALTQAPSYYSPYGSHFETTKGRQEYILERMFNLDYITKEQLDNAKREKLVFAPPKSEIKAPHFVMYIREYLEERYGKDFVESGGLKVYTTLDWNLQNLAEEIVFKQAAQNKKNYNANNAALVSVDPKTGQILVMVGSKNYFGQPEPQGCISGKNCLFDPNVNVAIRLRQPGSSFKPFAYAAAFKKGFTPDTIVFDLKTEFAVDGAESYQPKNYDEKFRGPVTMRQALAQSLNIPSVKTLYLAGVNDTLNTAQDLGINTLRDRSRYGLSLVLGGGEVRLLEETAAYGVFAAEGIKHALSSILKVEDGDGNIIEEYNDKPTRVLDSQIARIISSILSDNNARSPIFGLHSKLFLEERPVAVKTGTTQENRDGWTVGYTPSMVVGVWAGNNDNTPMPKGDGVYVATPIWNEFMKQAYESFLPKDPENFTPPEPIITNKDALNGKFANTVKVKVDKISGKLATEFTPPDLIEERTYQEVHCILYYVDKDNPQGEGNNRNDPQFNNWEPPVIAWALAPERGGKYNLSPPQEYDDIHTKESQPSLNIYSPRDEEIINTRIIKIEAGASALRGIRQLDFFFDNNLAGTDFIAPYQIIFDIPQDTQGTRHQITVKAYDQYGSLKKEKIDILLDLPGIEDKKEINSAVLSLISETPPRFKLELKDNDGNLVIKQLTRIDLYYYEEGVGEESSLFAVSLDSVPPNSEYEMGLPETLAPNGYYFFAQIIDEDNNVIKSNKILLNQ